MLTVRNRQVRRLAWEQRRRFENELVDHLFETWPEKCAAQGRPAVEERVHEASLRATYHGFSTERDVRRYVKLAFVWSPDFDRSPPTAAWAGPILANTALSPRVRMNRLWDRSLHELELRAAEARDV